MRLSILLLPVALGFALDLLFGDPYFLPHPIRFIGALISKGEKLLRKFAKSDRAKLIAGGLLTAGVVGICTLLPLALLVFARGWALWLGVALETLFCYQIFALRSLKTESMKVYDALKRGDLDDARKFLSYIVGRDTNRLDESQIVKATIETVAENTTDAVIAPMIYLFIGGAPLGFCYKAINTLDSMIGYKNEKYLYFGRAAARLDDVANYIPARFAAMLMMLSTPCCSLDFKNAVQCYGAFRRSHKSPNSAQTESVCAGALGVQLAGDAMYFGEWVKKPTIGNARRDVCVEDIKNANSLAYAASLIGFGLLFVVKLAILLAL